MKKAALLSLTVFGFALAHSATATAQTITGPDGRTIFQGPLGQQPDPRYDRRYEEPRYERHQHSHLGNLPQFYVLDRDGRPAEVFQRQGRRGVYYEYPSGRDVGDRPIYHRGTQVYP
jgi:hypothetical protein